MRFHAAFLVMVTATIGSATPPTATPRQGAAATSNVAPSPPAASASGSTGATAAPQAQQNFVIVNNSGHTLTVLNVSPKGERSWGPNVLGGDKLGTGESAEITFPFNTTQCEWDIQAIYDDGTNTDMRNVDLCTVATVTLTPN